MQALAIVVIVYLAVGAAMTWYTSHPRLRIFVGKDTWDGIIAATLCLPAMIIAFLVLSAVIFVTDSLDRPSP